MTAGYLEGSIPANAGEPVSYWHRRTKPRVYPRERGGTRDWRTISLRKRGLSPRTRGNPAHPPYRSPVIGSIPANAGEPLNAAANSSASRVYPRERGGTPKNHSTDKTLLGLSPRTRGNPALIVEHGKCTGSIPANAGEPCKAHQKEIPSWVYPRERGGT